jgi:O-methyltransferase involved in polyketide biosynthesis
MTPARCASPTRASASSRLTTPATQRDKRRRLAALAVAASAITYVSHDITHGGLSGALAAAGHARDRASLFICEGLLLYLTTPVIEELLHDLRASASTGSQLALSAREQLPRASAIAGVRQEGQRLLLAVIGEPRRSLFSAGQLDELLERSGWKTVHASTRGRTHGGLRGILVLAE